MLRTLLALAAAALTLLGIVWGAPRLMDWERWRPEIAAIASQRLGRPVTIEGPIRLTLLPQPRIEAAGISIGGPGEDLALTANVLRMRVALPALLANRIQPREIVLAGADLTLAWPPSSISAFRAPAWLTVIEARIEDGRLRIGDLVLDGFTGQLSSGGAADALRFEGGFAWRGLPVRFGATLGRAGWDAVAPLEVSLSAAGTALRAVGVLQPEGGFEGRVEASGPDLSALVPAPAGPFRAIGRFIAGGDLMALEDLALDLQGAPARGAVALRLAPQPRLDLALAAARLDLDAWGAALQAAGTRGLPLSVDLSAEAATFRGIALRRLRGAAFMEGERLTLSDVSALLPGDAEVEIAGASAATRLELSVRFTAPDLRSTLDALGAPVGATDPARLREASGRFRLVLEDGQVSIPEVTAVIDGTRLSGAGLFHGGARPAIGLGLTVDRLALDGLLPEGWDLGTWRQALAGFDANLRLEAGRLDWWGMKLDRVALDLALEQGRLTLRRGTGRLGEADATASGSYTLSPTPRFSDLSLEVSASSAAGVLALVPGTWPDGTPLAQLPLRLTITGGGPGEGLGLKASAELGEVRAETQVTLDVPALKATGSLTLRHPGAPRLLTEALGPEGTRWLGEGSISMVAQGSVGPTGVTAERLDLVAGELRLSGQGGLALSGPRPKLTGRVTVERLPLPAPAPRSRAPLPLEALAGWDADVAWRAQRIEAPGLPVVEQAQGRFTLGDSIAVIGMTEGRVAGGSLSGSLRVEAGLAPRMVLEGKLGGAAISGSLFDLPLDIASGRLEGELHLEGRGSAPAALLSTLGGTARIGVASGVLNGFDVPAVVAAARLPDQEEAAIGLRRGLLTGATTLERLDAGLTIAAGRGTLAEAGLVAEGGAVARFTGDVDLARGTVDMQVLVPAGEGPPVVLRLTGPGGSATRIPEISAWTRWRVEQN